MRNTGQNISCLQIQAERGAVAFRAGCFDAAALRLYQTVDEEQAVSNQETACVFVPDFGEP